MTDADMLYRAVLAYPAEDAPRLVYADWLAEHGQGERGEFVRVQCELARTSCHSCDGSVFPCSMGGQCRKYELRQRQRELLKTNFGAWTDGLPDPLVMEHCPSCENQGPDYETGLVECRRCECTGLIPTQDNVVFRRGFIAELTGPWIVWLAHEANVFWHPTQMEGCLGCDFGIVHGKHPMSPSYKHGDCNGTGRIPREMPATAQPIEKVTFTVAPLNLNETRTGYRNGHRSRDMNVAWVDDCRFTRHPEDAEAGVNIWRCDRWPGVEFAMPEREAAEERERRNRPAFPTTTISGW
jgi:uncharacterized protein (TIGR02996 family)